MPESGKWANAGMVRGRGVDVAWIVKDASKHYRVPQRRKRVFLVASFGEKCAAKILFIPQSLSGYFAARENEGQGASAALESGSGSPNYGRPAAFIGGASPSAGGIGYSEQVAPTLRAGPGSTMMPCVCEPAFARTLTARGDSSPCADRGQNVVCVAGGQANAGIIEGNCPTLTAAHEQPYLVHPKISGTLCASGAGLSRPAGMASETDLCVAYSDIAAVDCRNMRENGQLSGTLQSKSTGGYALNAQNPVRTGYILRRLTPIEAERLMAFPDNWTKYGREILSIVN
jgi:DNA (cytosine-5)-methyltransferase 1